jgi:Zinc finger, ZZ type
MEFWSVASQRPLRPRSGKRRRLGMKKPIRTKTPFNMSLGLVTLASVVMVSNPIHMIPLLIPITELPVKELVTCTDCADYDLCMMCFSQGDHGHHPGHVFQPVSENSPHINSHILSLCKAGRGFAHAAICDGCDKVFITQADIRDHIAHIYLSISLESATSV